MPRPLSFPVRKDAEKVRLTVLLPFELAEEVRDASAFLAGHPLHLSLTKLVTEALTEYVGKLKKARNGGKTFPARPGALKHGRQRP